MSARRILTPIYPFWPAKLFGTFTNHAWIISNNGIKFVSDGAKIYIDVITSMDNGRNIKMSRKMIIEKTKSKMLLKNKKISRFCVELILQEDVKSINLTKNDQLVITISMIFCKSKEDRICVGVLVS